MSGEERAAQVGGEERAAGRSGVRPSATEGMSGTSDKRRNVTNVEDQK
ncbi:hypothetical protein FB554_0298 [Barrientosiimonas humi]|uniref:Uncharacterized protein n=1 Tax=Barrientosiimonas humi TaxID=999931 RepID=A0A542X8L9_9MICO|nr:hypothetical protein FB554_0298 [Barrientosiimonas humi]CAG7572169.1 hypothetical protein BH39T_PBIAJDOK_00780 [Barrientosiimonas humi]